MDLDSLIQSVQYDHPRYLSKNKKICALTLLILFGTFFANDNPNQLKHTFQNELNLSYPYFIGLNVWYFFPTIIVGFVSGILVDHVWGTGLSAVIFGTLAVFGQALFTIGVSSNEATLMLLGRGMFGVGSESLTVVQATYTSRFFQYKQLDILLGWQIIVFRAVSFNSTYLMYFIYTELKYNLRAQIARTLPLLMSSLVCLVSLVSSILLYRIEYHTPSSQNSTAFNGLSKFSLKNTMKTCRNIFMLTAVTTLTYSMVIPFATFENTYLSSKNGNKIETSNNLMSIKLVLQFVPSPLIGYVTGYLGKKLDLLTVAVLLSLSAHLLAALTISNISLFIITVIEGLAYCIIATLIWTIIPLLVHKDHYGTAYGFLVSVMNLSVHISTIMTEYLPNKYGYITVEIVYSFCCIIGILAMQSLYNWDRNHNGILNGTKNNRSNVVL